MDTATTYKLCNTLNDSSQNQNQNAKGTKHRWTIEEDEVLVQGLLELVVDGWKTDAGTFKQGYTKILEKYLHTKIPNCTLKASPHIQSRLKRLKTHYYAIKDMLCFSTSAFKWDDTRNMIVADKEVYNQWCKTHPTAIGLYGKPFPHFDNLDVAFAKNRAIDKHEAKRVKYDNEDDDDDVCDSLLTLLDKLDEAYAETAKNIQQITSYFLHEKHRIERRNQIVPLLTEIEGLSTTDVVKATVLFFKNNNLCDYFFDMNTPELRKVFVYFVLKYNVVAP